MVGYPKGEAKEPPLGPLSTADQARVSWCLTPASVTRAKGWTKARRVVAKVEWHQGELYPRVGFIVTNLARPSSGWSSSSTAAARPSSTSRKARTRSAGRGCPATPSATTRCGSSFTRSPTTWPISCARWPCREEVEHWSLTTLREKLIKIGARTCATAATSSSSSPRWRCPSRCSPRSSAGSTGSDQSQRRHEHRAQRWTANQQARCVHHRPRTGRT